MSVSTGGGPSGDDEPMSAINTTPLVDVMLVLLIIFLITIPVVTQSIQLSLPKERNVPTQTKPENILLAVSKDGDVYWNTRKLPDIEALVFGHIGDGNVHLNILKPADMPKEEFFARCQVVNRFSLTSAPPSGSTWVSPFTRPSVIHSRIWSGLTGPTAPPAGPDATRSHRVDTGPRSWC